MEKKKEQLDGAMAVQFAVGMFLLTVAVLVGVGLFIGWLVWA